MSMKLGKVEKHQKRKSLKNLLKRNQQRKKQINLFFVKIEIAEANMTW